MRTADCGRNHIDVFVRGWVPVGIVGSLQEQMVGECHLVPKCRFFLLTGNAAIERSIFFLY